TYSWRESRQANAASLRGGQRARAGEHHRGADQEPVLEEHSGVRARGRCAGWAGSCRLASIALAGELGLQQREGLPSVRKYNRRGGDDRGHTRVGPDVAVRSFRSATAGDLGGHTGPDTVHCSTLKRAVGSEKPAAWHAGGGVQEARARESRSSRRGPFQS